MNQLVPIRGAAAPVPVLRVANACELLGLKRRQVFRLLRGLNQNWPASLLSKHRGKPSNHRLPAEVRTLTLSIVREQLPTLARHWRRRSWQSVTALLRRDDQDAAKLLAKGAAPWRPAPVSVEMQT
jgi:hypothetical protein